MGSALKMLVAPLASLVRGFAPRFFLVVSGLQIAVLRTLDLDGT